MKVFFESDLGTVATFWRVFRRDGVAMGFTTHDRDLLFAGLLHRAAPGMVPTAIRMTTDIQDDSAEVEGALSHASISEQDLEAGLFDDATISIGAVDWETLESAVLFSGQIGRTQNGESGFSAQLRSAKHVLSQDLTPRTSPTCRAMFCGKDCGLSSERFSSRRRVLAVDAETNQIEVADVLGDSFIDGTARLLAGPQTGLKFGIVDANNGWLSLDRPISSNTPIGAPIELIEGCDHTLSTCASRFDNARNFRGEPYLPGNDLLARYGRSSS
ncbi:MAG: DUF2163 domain-containing protein [Pseudomonadota bacterium]